MAVLYPARARQVYAPKRHKHPISGFGRILAFLEKKIFCVKCALCVQILGVRAQDMKAQHMVSL